MPRPPRVFLAENAALLTRGQILGYDTERMAFLFTMTYGASIVDCEISSVALDDLHGSKGTRPDERETQFRCLRDAVERLASYAFEQQGRRQRERLRIFSKHVKAL
ncbi:DUF1488 family protein [Bradyrhizobium japonicum]|uniref:DUF1488 family protein n=1 Tax=Bradyrhizobium japonicum TaxID=375 RepID=UPI0024BFFC83|nr:DUF1488 family protein [Bradyrhizobium japonicum]